MAKRKKGKKRFATCLTCGQGLKRLDVACRKCGTPCPAGASAAARDAAKAARKSAGKSAAAVRAPGFIGKAAGGNAVVIPITKAARRRPWCPACKIRGKGNCCPRCSRPYTAWHAARAEKSARAFAPHTAAVQPGTAFAWEAEARRQHDPQAREECWGQVQKARQARGEEGSHLAALLVKASGASSLREAWLRESDPRMREVLREALYEGGQSA